MTKGQSRILKDCAYADCVLLFAIVATPQKPFVSSAIAIGHFSYIYTATMRTGRHIAPTLFFHKFNRRRFICASQWQITVDFNDLADFAEQWLKTGVRYCIADIAPAGSGDGIVNMPDFAVLANNWLEGD